MRKTQDVYKIWWRGEVVDTFPRGGADWKQKRRYANQMAQEYSLAFPGTVEIKPGREPIAKDESPCAFCGEDLIS